MLAGIVMANLTNAKARGRDAKRISDIKSIQLALELYYNDNLSFPINIYAASGALVPNYLSVVPYDPNITPVCTSAGTEAGCYRYDAWTLSTGSVSCNTNSPSVKYHLGAMLEQSSNSALLQDTDSPHAADAGYKHCNGSPSEFYGQSLTASGNTPCSNVLIIPYPNGAGVVENCFDVTN